MLYLEELERIGYSVDVKRDYDIWGKYYIELKIHISWATEKEIDVDNERLEDEYSNLKSKYKNM